MDDPAKNLAAPEKVTAAWLFQHVTVGGWAILGGIVVAAFVAGVGLAQTTFVTEWLGKDASKKDIQNPQSAMNNLSQAIAAQIEELAKAHTTRLTDLSKAYLREEEAASNDVGIEAWKEGHSANAKNIEEAIAEENRSFQQHVSALYGLNAPNAK